MRDTYQDISLAINIEGFEAYRCISDVYIEEHCLMFLNGVVLMVCSLVALSLTLYCKQTKQYFQLN